MTLVGFTVILAVVAFICTLGAASEGKPPLWVSVLLLCFIEILRFLR